MRKESLEDKRVKRKVAFIVVLVAGALASLPGCRREDVREMTVLIPGLTEGDKAVVIEALKKYNGINKSSYAWDMGAKTLTLRYDSMQLAEANVRYAIDERGVKVAFPEKAGNRAGH